MTLANDARAMQMTRNAGIRFTENRGQVADTEGNPRPEILYTADAQGARLYFTARGVSYAFRRAQRPPSRVSEATGRTLTDDPGAEGLATEATMTSVYRMDMCFEGANPLVRVRAEDLQRGYTNYYDAHCPDGITYVRSFGTIIYEDLYEKIDLVYRASTGRVKYEFIVHPGGDPADIRLRYSGAAGVTRDADGGLAIGTPLGAVQEETPYSYQGSTPVGTSFVVDGNAVRFEVGAYDAARELVIDPWSTYYGGSSGEQFQDVSYDGNGNVRAAGFTNSMDFPVQNACQATLSGTYDGVIVSFSSTGMMQWSTYYGGSADEGNRQSIAHDASGYPCVAMATGSIDFPVTAGCYQSALAGDADVGLVKLASDGTRLWATYLGGTLGEAPNGVDVDGNGNILLGGATASFDFPVLNAFQATNHAATPPYSLTNGFLCSFSGTGQMNWSTYLGGSITDYVTDVACAPDNSIAVTGITQSANFPVTPGAFQMSNAYPTSMDVFLAKFSSIGSLTWATYYGGIGISDQPFSVDVDNSGNLIVAGYTNSPDFPVGGGLQSSLRGVTDGFVFKFTASGTRIWGTLFGGSERERYGSVAADANGDLYILYSTESADVTILNAFQLAHGGSQDAFVLALTPSCSMKWATYCGGLGWEVSQHLAVGQTGTILFCGSTPGMGFPILNAQQGAPVGGGDAFIACLGSDGYFPVSLASLTAVATDAGVLLAWRTETETDNAGFIIERSGYQEGSWERLGFVAGAGTTNAPQHYSFTDALPPSLPPGAQLRYRLRQTDLDGRETLSPVVAVTPAAVPSAVTTLFVFPNPAAGASQAELRLPRDGDVTLALYDRLGRKLRTVYQGSVSRGTHAIMLELTDLPPGAYYLRAESRGEAATARIAVTGR